MRNGAAAAMNKRNMTKWDRKTSLYSILSDTAVGNLMPSHVWQTDIGPVRACANHAGASGFPTHKEQSAFRGRSLRSRFETFWDWKKCVPDGFMPVVITKVGTHGFLDFDFTEPRRILWPTHGPARHWREMSLVRAIPCFGCDFGKCHPAKSGNKVGSRKESPILSAAPQARRRRACHAGA